MTVPSITDAISDATHDLICVSAGLVVVDSHGTVFAWKRFPILIRRGGFREQGEFGVVLADRNLRRHKKAVKLLEDILAVAKSMPEFGQSPRLGMYINEQTVQLVGFGHVGWYPTGVISAGKLKLV